MDRLKEVLDEVEVLRAKLHILIMQKKDIKDLEIIAVSKMLDSMLNEYSKLMKENDKKVSIL